MKQGNDRGTQYRSAIYTTNNSQAQAVLSSKDDYQQALTEQGRATITTEIAPAGRFYYAETYHQQYLAKNPDGYCGLGGTGVCLPHVAGLLMTEAFCRSYPAKSGGAIDQLVND